MRPDTPANVSAPTFRLRLGLLLWAAGMLGVGVLATALPQELRQMTALPAPLWILVLASVAQSALLLALAVAAGVVLAPKVGLHAPAFEALAAARPIAPALKPQLAPGLFAGVLGGVLLFGVIRYAPEALVQVQGRFEASLLTRMLYGGVTEELLARWGVMTLLVWLTWRYLQQRHGASKAAYVWLAIAVSALLFGAGHLPAAVALVGTLDATLVAFVVGANTAFGSLFGYLFWRYGLESAIVAHALAHLVSFLLNLA